MRYPVAIFVISLLALWLSVQAGAWIARKTRPLAEGERDDLDLVISSGLTLLALIIGFSFSMAVSRYDQRKSYEEEEANAIGTEYVRADLLPPGEAAKVKQLLVQYLDQRLLFYEAKEWESKTAIDAETTRLQNEMWSTVAGVAKTQQTPMIALAVSGMNDVLNRQGYTQAAWWNRIPTGAWVMMATLSICCSALIGYGTHQRSAKLYTIMPFLVSIAFFMIADIDSPRRGVIRVAPQNLISLSQSLHGQ
ncbi:MAG: hypothetical protein JOZ33_06270 [Acidobacteriaceae bacterium]|nr:hypothetical protein [Acidobacteriaceae bacterium]